MAILLVLWNIFLLISNVQVHGRTVAVMADVGETSPNVTSLVIDGIEFPGRVTAPVSPKSYFLGGAGEGSLTIGGSSGVYNTIGVYLGDEALRLLAGKWKGKSADELAASSDFFRDIFIGKFDKFTRFSFNLPLTGPQFSQAVADIVVAESKAAGTYDRLKVRAVNQFLAAFKDETFPKGSSVLFTHLSIGALAIAFSSDGSIPKVNNAVIAYGVSLEVLQGVIGENGVSPAAKRSLAVRTAELLDKFNP